MHHSASKRSLQHQRDAVKGFKMKRYTIGFPSELEDKVQKVAQENYNSFAGAVLFIVSDWFRQQEEILRYEVKDVAPPKLEKPKPLIDERPRKAQ